MDDWFNDKAKHGILQKGVTEPAHPTEILLFKGLSSYENLNGAFANMGRRASRLSLSSLLKKFAQLQAEQLRKQ